jgi:hypothetical protein
MMSARQAVQFRRKGWCIIKGVMPYDEARVLFRFLSELLSARGVFPEAHARNRTWRDFPFRVNNGHTPPAWSVHLDELPFFFRPAVILDNAAFAAPLAHPALLKVVCALLGRNPCIASVSGVVHDPGTPCGKWYPGGPFTAVPPDDGKNESSRPRHIVAHFLCSHFTRANGGLLLRSRSGRATTVTAPIGSVVLADGRFDGANSPNNSDFLRSWLVVDYLPDLGADQTKYRAQKLRRLIPTTSGENMFALPETVRALLRYWVDDIEMRPIKK